MSVIPASQDSSENQIESLQPKYYVSVEGNIGCGKSTFLKLLRRKISQVQWIEEPVSEWQNLGGQSINILEKYYQNPKRWGFTFQVYAIYTRIKVLNQAMKNHPNKLIVCERSILADKYVFSELMKDLGYMDASQYEIFMSLYDNLQKMKSIGENKIIYLKCSPKKCCERTKLRQRTEEAEIPLSYLQAIHAKYENWIKDTDEEKVLTIETEEDFQNDEKKVEEMLKKINNFFKD